MRRISKHLDNWVQEGIISSTQSQEILDYQQRHGNSQWATKSFLLLGAIVISIGVISVVAANWYEIPDGVKLGIDFILLSVIGFLVFDGHQNQRSSFEPLLIAFSILCLATIGLISQIFHIDGKLYQAFFTWSIITFLLFCFTSVRFSASLWMGAWVLSSLLVLGNNSYLRMVFADNSVWFTLLMVYPLLGFLIKLVFGLVHLKHPLVRALTYWTLFSGLVGLGIADVLISISEASIQDELGFTTFYPGYVVGVASLILIWVRAKFTQTQKIMITGVIALYLLMYTPQLLFVDIQMVGGGLSIVILGLAATYFGLQGHRKTFNLLVQLIGVRFLIFYFQAFGGLAKTGVGLIVSGLLIVAMVLAWQKYKHKLHRLLQEMKTS